MRALYQADVLDPAGVRKLILKFEKAITKNNEFRVKYADDPSKYVYQTIFQIIAFCTSIVNLRCHP